VPSLGSLRISDRFSLSSTKYGPSVIAGRTTHIAAAPPAVLPAVVAALVAAVVAALVALASVGAAVKTVVLVAAEAVGAAATGPVAVRPATLGAQAASAAALMAPSTASASRRLKSRPTGRSSLSISILPRKSLTLIVAKAI